MSGQSLEPEALREALSSLAEYARPRPDCPSPAEIWAAVQGELSRTDARRVVDHVAGCLVCAEAWDLTRDLVATDGLNAGESTAEKTSPEGSGSDQAGTGRWPLWLGLAAALLLAIQIPFMMSKSPPQTRGEGQEIALELSSMALPRSDFVLRWSGPEAAELYSLELSWAFDEDYEELPPIEIPAAGPSMTYRVGPETLADIPQGARLIGWLRAFAGDKLLDEKSFTVILE